MKQLLALAVLAAVFGAGLLAAGQVLVGLLLVAPGLLVAVLCGVRLVGALRARPRSRARSPLADEPGVTGPRRLVGVLALTLAAVPLAGAVGLLLAFGRIALDPGIEPLLRGASVPAGLVLAGIPGFLGGLLLVSGLALLRGNVHPAGGIDLLAKIALGLAGLATVMALLEERPPTEFAYDRPSVIVVGVVTVVLAGAVVAAGVWLDRARTAAHDRRTASQSRTAPR